MNSYARLILEQNKNKGEQIAVVDRNGHRKVSWNTFKNAVLSVANYAIKRKLSGVVPVCMERSVEAAATILGLNLAGVGVTPIAYGTPSARCELIAKEINNEIWTKADFDKAVEQPCTDEVNEKPFEPAIVIFTSGSTGTPKGVMLSNEAICNAIIRYGSEACFDYKQGDIALQTALFSFAVFIMDLLAPLYAGAEVHILPELARKDAKLFTEYVNTYKITKMYAAPKFIRLLGDIPTVRIAIVAGERLSGFAPKGYKLLNIYGLTETTVGSCAFEVDKKYDNTPIGKPLPGYDYILLDEEGKETDEGEICISGGIAMGYYNNPELTKEVFVKDAKTGKILLHSGDIAKRLPDGNLLFLNRKDFMVKINGQRVEPGEAESALKQIAGIKDAVVKGFEDEGRTYLCAFYESDKEIEIDVLRELLAKKLPSYMIPSYYVHFDKLPINANGKIDRKALTPPKSCAKLKEYAAPIGEYETRICRAFEHVLHIERIGALDEFLYLGGDSISAMEVVRLLEGIELSAFDILSGKSPRGIAGIIDNKPVKETDKTTLYETAPLTDSQMGVYLQCMDAPDSVMYNIPMRYALPRKENMTGNSVKAAIDKVIAAHPALYAYLKSEDDGIMMCRAGFPEEGICEIIDKELENYGDIIKPFSLTNGPLCRVKALLTENELIIYFDCHHIVADGTSASIIIRQIVDALLGKEILPEKVDAFALPEFTKASDASMDHAKSYFENLLAGNEIDSNLIFDRKPDENTGYKINQLEKTFVLPDLSGTLQRAGITESSFFMGAFGYTLAKMTGQTQSLFTVAESGRKSALTDRTVAMMVRTMPLLLNIDEEKDSFTLLEDCQNQFYKTVQNDIYPFVELANNFGLNSDIMFVYQSELISDFESELGHVSMKQIPFNEGFYNLSLSITKQKDNYALTVGYRAHCYDQRTIERFIDIMQRVCLAFANNETLKEIQFIDKADLEFLDGLNATESEFNESETIVDIFRKTAKKYPEKDAVVCKERHYTYKQADELTERLASYISSLGIGTGNTVSVLIHRNEYMLLASLGALKAGAVYQPLDPAYPTERLTFMCKDADSKLLIADRDLLPILPDYSGKILCTDEISALTEITALPTPKADDVFVLLYTSGTTGLPKGCQITHRNVSAYIHAFNEIYKCDDSSVSGAFASYGFDAHLSEIYPMIPVGGTLHIITEDIRLDFPALKKYFEDNKITNTVMTTQVARQFVTEYPEVKYLRSILSGGEKLATVNPPKSYTLTNGYGPSEATVMVTYFIVNRVYDDIPIGKALPNVKLYVVDAYGRRMPVGVPGELIAAGSQVSKGYLNREEKTKEVFKENTFEENPKAGYENCYMTGDIVRFTDSGNLEIIGRRDMQVKIRGFRIELSEIETVIRQFKGITDTTVIAVDDPAGGKCIHAYIVAPEKIDINRLNQFIKSQKPAYMVPAATMQIEAIPLTPNFKVDKRKLPPIESQKEEAATAQSRTLTELEQKLFDILSEIVGHKNFEVETDFVSAGISSITSIRLAVQIYKQFGLHLTSKDIMDGGSILSVENSIVSAFMNRKPEDEASEIKESYPLTQTQIGIYTDSLINGMDTYNIPALIELDKDTDIPLLKGAVISAVKAHPSILCHIYADEKGEVKNYPQPDTEVEISEEAIENLPPATTHFEFTKAPLFKFRIITCKGSKYLHAELHHIIADGESLRILLRDIERAYNGEEITAEEYSAYQLAEDEEKARKGKELELAKVYYDSVFKGAATDFLPCPDKFDKDSFGQCDYEAELDRDKILRFCKDKGISESLLLSGAFAVTVSGYSAQEDAVFTTVHNGRTDPRTENLVSMLVKTLPVYIETQSDMTTDAFLQKLSGRINKLKKYDLYSYADAVRDYGIANEPMFIYQGDLWNEMPLGRLIEADAEDSNKKAKAEFTMELSAHQKGYRLHMEFNAGKYSQKVALGFAKAYKKCVADLIASRTLGEINICTDEALEEFADFNNTAWPITYRPVYRVFEESAERHPEKLAIVSQNGSLTYDELNRMSNDLAGQLCALGLPPHSSVEVMTGRTYEIYLSEIGILKSGNVFLFVSPEYPDERIKFITADANAKAIVTTREIAREKAETINSLGLPVIYADDIGKNTKAEALNLEIDRESLAYMIYTSGSTGKPKGVTVTQKGIVNISDPNPFNGEVINFANDQSVSAAVSAFTFDASVLEGLIALLCGSTVCIATDEEIHDPEKMCAMLQRNKVTSLLGTPSFLINLLDYEGAGAVIKNMRTVLAGGEAFSEILLNKLSDLNPNLTILNGYGPSEATISASCKILKKGERITIGTPHSNTEIYCLDKQNHILPMGALGELTIVGDGVGKGYLNRDDLTKKTFITVKGKPAFKTGDLAVITHNGDIEFHGRVDNQVKIRGLRVELGEIESAINQVEGIKSAVALVKGDGENKYLAAYYTASREITPEEIKESISKSLTAYMVPKAYMQLDSMPMTQNGKINRKELPEIDMRAHRKTSAAANDTERDICEMFASVLGLQEVYPEDNFFEIGGSSLSASRVVMQLKSKGYKLEYQTIFDNQTPRELSIFLGATPEKAAKTDVDTDGDPTPKELREMLKCNTLSYADKVTRTPLGDVLLTGAVGFLGMHILWYLLHLEKGHIYCLVRKGSFQSPEKRLNAVSYYYFEQCLQEVYSDRITVIDGDVTSENLPALFHGISLDTIINCAAIVKHYSSDDSIEFVNVHGVENLISLAKGKGAKLIQISTTSVPGVHTEQSYANHLKLHENQLFIGNDMGNKYLISKYHAETRMLKAISEGMKGKIIRVGNLMGRHYDGEFQINMVSNAFLNALKGFAAIGKSPISHCTDHMEFSPVDCTAKVIVMLAGTNDMFTVFHANNRDSFDEMMLIDICNRCGVKINPTDDKIYYDEFNKLMGDPRINKRLSALLTNDRPDLHSIEVNNKFTANILYRIGYTWPFVDNAYLEKVIMKLKSIGFFDNRE